MTPSVVRRIGENGASGIVNGQKVGERVSRAKELAGKGPDCLMV